MKNMKIVLLAGWTGIVSLFFMLTSFHDGEKSHSRSSGDLPSAYLHSPWVDSVFNSLTFEQRIGQLLMVAAYSNKDRKHVEQVAGHITKYGIGGVIFFQGGPLRQAHLTNYYQHLSKTPLLVGMDAEWGLGMRLDSCIAFPRQMALGAVQNTGLILRMGEEIGRQLKRMGVHLNFAPVVDVNNQPANPVIGIRSFGEDVADVALRSALYMTGMQEQRILTAAKHFPGHGNASVDSHQALPVINGSYRSFDTLEWRPYRELIQQGLTGVLAGHLCVPALDSTPHLASSLSHRILTGILRDSLHFNGLVYTDALNMKGVSMFFRPGEAEVMALKAGVDVLLMPDDVPRAVAAIRAAVDSGQISRERIELSCRKILAAKQWAGLNRYAPVDTAGLFDFLNRPEAVALNRQLAAASLTVLQNHNGILPLKHLDHTKTAILITGRSTPNHFLETVKKYEENDYFFLDDKTTPSQEKELAGTLSAYSRVIAGIHNTRYHSSPDYGISPRVLSFIERLSKETKVILCLFAPPYALSNFRNRENMPAVVVAYQDAQVMQEHAAQLLYGALGADGRLPVTVDSACSLHNGITTAGGLRLRYAIPEEAGIPSCRLRIIDTMMTHAIDSGMFPGCQILAACNGTVFFNRTYGTTRYDLMEPVRPEHIYDLASITKIAATLPTVMLLYDREEIRLRDRLNKHLNFSEDSEIDRITLIDLLTHQARLPAFIPFYLNVLQPADTSQTLISKDENHPVRPAGNILRNHRITFNPTYITASEDHNHHRQIARDLYVMDSFRDTIFSLIRHTTLKPRKQYLYSDLGFILLTELIEQKTGLGLDAFASHLFYRRLGASTLGYCPLNRFPKERIVPTANDTVFRKQWLQGYVHDGNAALMGGVSGHAGLFGNANDLAKLMQMYLNKGEYGGERFIEEKTVEEFTSCPYCQQGNRRGTGFDKPETDPKKISPIAKNASPESFGHNGFTGTCVWMDPENGLLFVFLSNRVCPDESNNKLTASHMRSRIYRIFADAVNRSDTDPPASNRQECRDH
jgi:beta-glucosidase-like glycosyl hydrolase/CubicO group peptidase (beta-lactamase class C family)